MTVICSQVAFAAQKNYLVLLLVPHEDRSLAEDLHHAAAAHLADLRVEVRTIELADFPSESSARLTVVKRELATHSAISAFWWSPANDQVSIVTPELSDEPVVKTVPDRDEGWAPRCDVIASIVQSEITALITLATTGLVDAVHDNNDQTPRAEPEDDTQAIDVELQAGIGYAPSLTSTDGPLLHGVSVAAGVVLDQYFGTGLAIDLIQRAELDIPGASVELAQVPIRTYVAALMPLTDWRIGLRIGAVFNVWRLKGLTYEAKDARADDRRFNFAVATALLAEYRVLPWLAPWIEFGADLYPTRSRHVFDGETLLRLGNFRPRAMIGVGFTHGLE